MAFIKITPELLAEQARNLVTYAEQNDQVITDLDSIVNGLLTGWEGPAQEAFTSSYNQKRQTFQSFTEAMRAFSKEVEKFADVMKGEEDRQTRKAEELAL